MLLRLLVRTPEGVTHDYSLGNQSNTSNASIDSATIDSAISSAITEHSVPADWLEQGWDVAIAIGTPWVVAEGHAITHVSLPGWGGEET